MIRRFDIFWLLFSIQYVAMQNLVRRNRTVKCDGDPPIDVDPKYCCEIPPLFSEENLKDCDVADTGALDPLTCDQQRCLMSSQNLLYVNGDIDKSAVARLLDDWAENNSYWKPSVKTVKERCLADKIPITEHMCEANKQMLCISATLFQNCVAWNNEIDECLDLKSYVDQCVNYYFNLEPTESYY